MAGFSAADAAFTGFRVVWERPWAVAIWAAVQFVASLAINFFVATSAGPAFAQMASVGLQPTDQEKVLALFREVAPTYVAVLIGELVLAAVFYAAMNRAVMRPSESRFGYLRLASDELRQLGLFAVLILLALGVYIAVLLVASIVVGLLAALLGGGAQTAVGVGMAVLLPLLACAFIFLAVRLSLASPLTFAGGRVNVFGSWALTRGRFWPLFGTYLIAFALSFVVFCLTLAIALVAVSVVGGGVQAISQVLQSDTTVAAMLTAPRLVYLAITAIGAALTSPITMCPPATIYQSLAASAPAGVSRTFD